MSFDLAVWYPQKRSSNQEAKVMHGWLCEGDVGRVVQHPAIDAFYAELTAIHPEIDTIPERRIDNHDHCPWSCKLDHSPSYVIMSCVWSESTNVHTLVQDLARKHGLVTYDPQSEIVTYPDGSTGNVARDGALWVLGSFALLFTAIFVYSAQIAPSGKPMVLYIFAGLCGLMAVACLKQARRQRQLRGTTRNRLRP